MRSLTYKEASKIILGMFEESWQLVVAGAKPVENHSVHFDNVAKNYKYEENKWVAVSNDASEELKASVSIRQTSSLQSSLGRKNNRCFRRTGILAIKLDIKQEMGLTRLLDYANIIAEYFEGATAEGSLAFQGADFTENGVDGGYYQSEVVVAFHYDQVK